MNHMDEKMPSSIAPMSSANLPMVDEEAADNFKYVSS